MGLQVDTLKVKKKMCAYHLNHSYFITILLLFGMVTYQSYHSVIKSDQIIFLKNFDGPEPDYLAEGNCSP